MHGVAADSYCKQTATIIENIILFNVSTYIILFNVSAYIILFNVSDNIFSF